MTTYPDQEVLPGQFVSLLKAGTSGGYFKPFTSSTIKVFFLTELDLQNPDLVNNYEKYLKKDNGGRYIFTPLSAQQASQAKSAFAAINKVTGLNFEYTNDPSQGQIRLGIADTKEEDTKKEGGETVVGVSTGAVNIYWSSTGEVRSDILINQSSNSRYGYGDYGYYTLIHEIGHALGLDHLSEASGTSSPSFSRAVSVMSYANLLEGGNQNRPHGNNYGSTPLILDVKALQQLYGTRSHQAEDTRYIFTPMELTAEERFSEIANNDKRFYKNQIRAIWDSGGLDTLDATAYTESVHVDLRPGFLSSIGGVKNIAVSFETNIENIYGGSAADKLIGNELDNELDGGGGHDNLTGDMGVDTYIFNGDWGADFINDVDGKGKIKVNGNILTGGKSVGKNIWESEDKQWKYTLTELDDLIIAHATDPGRIVITDWSKMKAAGAANDLGIKLSGYSMNVSLREGYGTGPAPTGMAGTSRIDEGSGKTFSVYLDAPAKSGSTITLSLSDQQDKFKVITGDVTIPAHGAKINLSENQTEVSFALVQTGAEVTADGTAQLTASYREAQVPGQPASEPAVSNLWTIDLRDIAETSGAIRGDQHGPVKTHPDGTRYYDETETRRLDDGTLQGGITESNFNDVLKGTDGTNDKIYGLTGNDALSGLGGDDEIHGGDGDDLLGGGNGSDVLFGGDGNDFILTGDKVVGLLRRSPDDRFTPPTGETILVNGSVWGITTVDGNTKIVYSVNSSDRDTASDAAYGGDGNDDIIGGKGTDYLNGDAGNDELTGMGGGDILHGGDGSDKLWGDGLKATGTPSGTDSLTQMEDAAHGNDFLDGGTGDDTVFGQGGSDVLFGGAGNDVLWGDDQNESTLSAVFHGNDALNGEDGNDQLVGAGKDDVLAGGAGDDKLYGDDSESNLAGEHHGKDSLDGGLGNDSLVGGGKDDLLSGGDDDDTLFGDDAADQLSGAFHGNDNLDGGRGADLLVGGGKDDDLTGGAGDDELHGDGSDLAGEFHGEDALDGGDGNDVLLGGGRNDVLMGGGGDDLLSGDDEAAKLNGTFHGDDYLDGGDGADGIWGQGGNDTIYGGAGDDVIQADDDADKLAANFHGKDFVDGGDGNDHISGDGGDDVLLGGAGDDWISGEDEKQVDAESTLTGNDRISGGDGNDILVGGNGDDILSGDGGDDWLYGNMGNDSLDGGAGYNVLKGGAGNDTYTTSSPGIHIIEDSEGQNIVNGIDGMALSVTPEGMLVLQSGGRGVGLAGAMTGDFSGVLMEEGAELSVDRLVAKRLTAKVDLQTDGNNKRMLGGQAADRLVSNGANTKFASGKGNDLIEVNGKGATIQLAKGDGADVVTVGWEPVANMAAADKVSVVLGEGIQQSDISFEYADGGKTLKLKYSDDAGDVIQFKYGGATPGSVADNAPIGDIQMADGTRVNVSLTARVADEDAPFTYQVPGTWGAGVTFTAALAGGAPLPAWLTFAAATHTFSGTPANGDVGSFNVQVTATGSGQAGSTHTFGVVVRNVNDAPEKGPALPEQEFLETSPWTYDLPAGTFKDVDPGDKLTYSAKLADGRDLPIWLKINAQTGQLSNAPRTALAIRLSLVITATDKENASASIPLQLYVKSAYAGISDHPVVGTPGDDVLVGTSGSDVLIGGWGNDVLDGGAGNDELIGGNKMADRPYALGAGNDTYLFGRGDGNDILSNGLESDMDGWPAGPAGVDTLKFKAGIKPSDIKVSRNIPGSIWVGNRYLPDSIIFTIVDTGEKITVPYFHAANGTSHGVIDEVAFTDHPNVKWSIADINRLSLTGNGENDQIYGFATDDIIRPGAGNNTVWGYLGNDAYHFGKNDEKTVIYEFQNEGADKIVFDEGILPSDVLILRSFESPDFYTAGILVLRVPTGSTEVRDMNFFNASGAGGVESVHFANGTIWDRNYLLAHAQGSAGVANEFTGTAGDDQYEIDNPKDNIVEAPDGGVDSALSNVSYVLPANVENLTLTGQLPINGTGNAGQNILIGNDLANTLDWGGGGLDTLKGGLGNDTYKIYGPTVFSQYWPDSNESNEIHVNIVEATNGGIDELQTNAFYAKLPENVENLKVSSFVASSIQKTYLQTPTAAYYGNDLDNVMDISQLTSRLVAIELDGGAGNDTLIGNTEFERDGASYSSATAGVTVSLAITGAQNTGSAGTDTLKNLENLKGSKFNDVLTGTVMNNAINGGAGADRMIGAAGDDTYYVDDIGDVVVEAADEGVDRVIVKGLGDYTLDANVEFAEVELGDVKTSTIIGNNSDNSLQVSIVYFGMKSGIQRGMGGNDTLTAPSVGFYELDGGDGDDLLIGHYGNNTFIGGAGDDIYRTREAAGNEVIVANTTAVPAEVNTLQIQGITADQLGFRQKDNDLIIWTSGTDSIRVEKFFGTAGAKGDFSPVQILALDDYTTMDFEAISARVATNKAPAAQNPIAPAAVTDGQYFNWTLPYKAFVDDGGLLKYTARLEDGSALPSWVVFDDVNQTLKGSVRANGNETLRIKITATDEEGLSASAILELAITVEDKIIEGTSGNDTLRGGGGNDELLGLEGKDQLQGAGGNDLLDGGVGDDSLFGQAGADTLIGGLGNDSLNGGPGNDAFEYTKGDGQDTLDAIDVKTATDKLLIHGWLPSQTQLIRSGNHLFVRMGGSSTDQVALYNYFLADSTQDGAPANSKIDQIVFDNGDIWDQAKIDTVLAGGGSGGTGGGGTTPTAPPTTYTYAYVLADQYSDYTLTGNAPYVFKGNSKANKLTGNDGANVINGAAGNDTLTGGKGGDTYFLEAGTGQDTIVENDSTAGVNDLLQWGSNIRHDQIWLRKAGNNLEVSVIGTTNKAVVKDWYLGVDRHVEQIWANGKMLSDTKVQALVDAMAAFSPPAAGQTTLSTSYQTALNPVIAANWN